MRAIIRAGIDVDIIQW